MLFRRLGKKGESEIIDPADTYIFYGVWLLILLVVVGFIVALAGLKMENEVKTFEPESELVVQKLLYSRYGISYLGSGQPGRLYPGVIDLSKFDSKFLLKNLYGLGDGDTHLSMMVELFLDGEDKLHVLYLNEKWYERWLSFVKFDNVNGKVINSIEGKGGKDGKILKMKVPVIKENGEKTFGLLVVKVIISR